MRYRFILLLTLLLLPSVGVVGQITISSGGGWNTLEEKSFSFVIIGANSQEGLPGATAYLQVDTVITHFSISSERGEVVFRKVPRGQYRLCVEMLGYIPYREMLVINGTDAIPEVITLHEDEKMLEAAVVSDLATLFYHKNDTTVYNASAIKIGNNDVLADLLSKMPGIKLEGGKVFVNGSPVHEITVNNRTFFFGNLSLALENLPAKIVDKIRVFDRVFESGSGTDIAIGKKEERVMDVELKDEFKKGSFGNLSLNGGYGNYRLSSEGDKGSKGIAEAKQLLSIYNEKGQLTALSTFDNMSLFDGWRGKVAANYNTSHLKNWDNTVVFVGGYDKKFEDRYVERCHYAPEKDNIYVNEKEDGQIVNKTVEMTLESKRQGPFKILIKPSFRLQENSFERLFEREHRTYSDENVSFLSVNGRESIREYGLTIRVDNEKLAKERRKIQIGLNLNHSKSERDKTEKSSLLLNYISDRKEQHGGLSIVYTEPLAPRWVFNLAGDISYYGLFNSINTREVESQQALESLSSVSTISDWDYSEALYFTYYPKGYRISFGGRARQINNRISWSTSEAANREHFSTISPHIYIESTDLSKQIYIWGQRTPTKNMDTYASLVRTGVADLLIGNPFLNPTMSFYSTINYYKTRRFQLMLELRYDNSPIVYANWFSGDGVRCSFPVNSMRPGITITPFLNYYHYFSDNKRIYLYLNARGTFRSERGYQALTGPVISETEFSHKQFIEDYWGDSAGTTFFSVASGFSESNTSIWDLTGRLELIYRTKQLTVSAQLTPNYYKSNYSLVPEAGEEIVRLQMGPSIDARIKKGIKLSSNLDYVSFKGFGPSYNNGFWNLDMEMGIDIDMISLSIKGKDLLNQSLRLSHSASAEYVQNVVAGHIGRVVLFSVGYLFGKGSSDKQRSSSRFVKEVTK